ncbi:MAG: FAD-binding oxidoreductase [Paracoccaceae bacterium]
MSLNPADVAFCQTLAGKMPDGVIAPVEPRYLEDPRRRLAGHAEFVARPRTTEEVAAIVRACSAARVGIVPYGGGTGLVLGQLAGEGPVPLILSLERMAAIRAIYPDEGVLIAEAGVILESVHEAASGVGRLFPLTLASQGSARIGGLLSTNAGGVNVVRYGNTRDLCLGIEAVLPDGSILHDLKRLRKDNSGYDVRNLLVGAEGTLGIITAASLKLHPLPASVGTAMLKVASPAAALRLLAMAQSRMAGCVSIFELIGRQGLRFLDEVLPDVRQPFADQPDWMVLIEVGLPEGIDAADALGGLFEVAAAQGLVDDGVIAQSAAQAAEFWTLREALPEANRRIGAVSAHDISLPLSEIAGFIVKAPEVIAKIGNFRINCFGHLGDGNLHYNVFPLVGQKASDLRPLAGEVKRAVHDLVMSLGGSFSAEHGVGRYKVDDLERYGDPAKLALMRQIKGIMDPKGIMNPGAVLRA